MTTGYMSRSTDIKYEDDALDHVISLLIHRTESRISISRPAGEAVAVYMAIAWQWYTINEHVVARDSEENNKPGLRHAERSGPAISSCQDQSFRASDGSE
jgi:hypothetical protein